METVELAKSEYYVLPILGTLFALAAWIAHFCERWSPEFSKDVCKSCSVTGTGCAGVAGIMSSLSLLIQNLGWEVTLALLITTTLVITYVVHTYLLEPTKVVWRWVKHHI